MNGFDRVYLKMDSGCTQLTITPSYSSGETGHLISGVRILLTEVGSTNYLDSGIVPWSTAIGGIPFSVSGSKIYTVDIDLHYDAGTYDSTYDRSCKLDIRFDEGLGDYYQFINSNNVVGLTDNVDGLIVSSEGHHIVSITKPAGIGNIGNKCYSVVADGSASFATGTMSEAVIKSDGTTPFIICLDNDGKKNAIFKVTITVKKSDGSTVSLSETTVSGKDRYYYVGMNANGDKIIIGNSPGTPFQNAAVDITVVGDPQGQGNNSVRLYLITMGSST